MSHLRIRIRRTVNTAKEMIFKLGCTVQSPGEIFKNYSA